MLQSARKYLHFFGEPYPPPPQPSPPPGQVPTGLNKPSKGLYRLAKASLALLWLAKLCMEDDLNSFCTWKTTSIYFVNGRRPQFIL